MPTFIGSYWFLSLCVLVSVVLAVAGLLIVRKFVPHDDLISHHDVAGAFLSIVGTLYAVVLGFIVVDALNTSDKARMNVEQEANALHDIFHMAEGLPPQLTVKVRDLCIGYANCMVNEEWKSMEHGVPSPDGHRLSSQLWSVLTRFQPENGGQQDVHQVIMTEMNELGDCRHARLIASTPTHDKIIWTVLFVGAVVTVVFTYFFGVERLGIQILMTALITIVLSLNLVLVAMFCYPFSGDVKVSSDAFMQDVLTFQKELTETH